MVIGRGQRHDLGHAHVAEPIRIGPWNSGGYSMEPTPMIAPWPCINRGTEWLVPMVPGWSG